MRRCDEIVFLWQSNEYRSRCLSPDPAFLYGKRNEFFQINVKYKPITCGWLQRNGYPHLPQKINKNTLDTATSHEIGNFVEKHLCKRCKLCVMLLSRELLCIIVKDIGRRVPFETTVACTRVNIYITELSGFIAVCRGARLS